VLGLYHNIASNWRAKRTPYLAIYIISIVSFLSLISHKEPKFLLPVFPPLFLIIGQYLQTHIKAYPKFIKSYVIFGVLLEICINYYFVSWHEIGAFGPIEHLRAKYPGYRSLIVSNKFEGNYLSLNHRPNGESPRMTFMTHDPLFVKAANENIPLIQSIEHPILESLELLTHLEHTPLPDFAIIDHIWPRYCREAVEYTLKAKGYELEKKFYYGMEKPSMTH